MNQEADIQRVLDQVPPPEQADPDAHHVLPHGGLDMRKLALMVIATIAVLAVLRWASGFFIPLMLGFVFYYALSPVVEALVRAHIPRWLGAGVLITVILWSIGASVWSMSDDANDLVNSLPEAAEKLGEAIRKRTGQQASPLERVQKAATELERATQTAGAAPPPAQDVQRVVIEQPQFNIRDHLWTSTIGLVSLVGQVLLVTFLTYFLLLSGDTFRRKLVKITGPTLSEKKLTVQALDEINAQMQRYLLVQLLASVGVGAATGLVFAFLGLKHAAVWGVAAGVLNLVPYIGNVLLTGAAALVAFLQFGEIEPAIAVTGASLVINTLEGYLLVPWATSKASSMNAVTVFIGVLAWGWLWGVWGLLLGIPIMMVIKAVCDRVEDLKAVGELLGT